MGKSVRVNYMNPRFLLRACLFSHASTKSGFWYFYLYPSANKFSTLLNRNPCHSVSGSSAGDRISFADPTCLVLPKSPHRYRGSRDFYLSAYENKISTLSNKNPRHFRVRVFVPGTGFEPAQPFGCCHLKTVRLPISPPGRVANIMNRQF